MKTILTFDIGGTNIRAGLFTEESIQPFYTKKIKTSSQNGSALENILSLIKEVLAQHPTLDAISMAVPGSNDNKNGNIIKSPNEDGCKNDPCADHSGKIWHHPVHRERRQHGRLRGMETWGGQKPQLYSLHHHQHRCGGAVIDNGTCSPVFGAWERKKSHDIVEDGPLCSCGKRGHLEALASGPAIAAYVRKKWQRDSPPHFRPIPHPPPKPLPRPPSRAMRFPSKRSALPVTIWASLCELSASFQSLLHHSGGRSFLQR